MADSVLNGTSGTIESGHGAQQVRDPEAYAAIRTAGRIPPKLYRMGEVVEYSGLSRQTIHNYATMGLLRETRWTQGGHRLYEIAQLKRRNKTMREIREYFASIEHS